ncbi:MAG TPA: glycosyltransferase, partial [Longimicrobiaceae bacterium]|nr:glycosyltransferase [Longimicrobiaceae bacterium]
MSAGEIATLVLVRMEWAILAYFLLVNGWYLLLLASAAVEMRQHVLLSRGQARWKMLGSRVVPSISMLAPAHDEAATIGDSVRALLALYYPNLEVVVVNDGSSDQTLAVLVDQFDLQPIHPIFQRRISSAPVVALYRSRIHPNLVVVDKQNGGKADALNAGLNLATGELVCAIDADTLIEPDALIRMVRPFVDDDRVIAAGGTIRIANASTVRSARVVETRVPRRALPGFQVVEYLRAFLFGRLGWNRVGGNLIISGAFGLFRRDAMIAAGGYLHDTVGEDMELVLRLRRRGYEQKGPHRVDFIPDPVAWTEAPATFAVLGRQRDRWQRGLTDVLWRHRRLFFNPRYGAMGMVAYPYFIINEMLAPVVEMVGLAGVVLGLLLGVIDWPFALLYFLVAYGLGAVLTFMALILEEMNFHRYHTLGDRAMLVVWALFENLGYRQLTVIWRLRGMLRFLRGSRAWGKMERRGFTTTGPGRNENVLPSKLLPLVFAVMLPLSAAAAQPPCPEAGNPRTEAGWVRYRAGDVEAARAEFAAALRLCPEHAGAGTGMGYVLLRAGEVERARAAFEAIAARDAGNVDALVGLGLAAWRQGDLAAVRSAFVRVQRLDPGNAEAREHLARLPEGLGEAPQRPPLVLPDTPVYPARTHGDRFEVRTARGWQPFYWKGVNLGAALPGKHPSEFPDSATYARWIEQIAGMGANVVRVYTIHPPHFYRALRGWNLAHAEAPLWLVHGVWTELPEDDDFEGAAWEGAFFAEMRRVVDLLHGRADLPPRPGHASGFYTADVSPWVLAYIIGREWEPFSVVAFNRLRAGRGGFEGRYLAVRGGSPMDAWLGKACEEIVAYEMRTYRAQRPVAYTNWPTLDPLPHPTESTVDEEIAIRAALGERVDRRPLEYDNDAAGLDAARVGATAAFPAGWFASYHAYPYYPDFMVLDPDYGRARSSLGPSSYFGYLRRLKAHHPGMPVVISEYGVPASIGSAHLQPQGWHHGGHTEAEMAAIDARLTREIAEAGMAGGAVFAWIDEWFKKNWIVIEFEIPLERNRLWLNRLDAEQHYGMLAMEPGRIHPDGPVATRWAAWQQRPALYHAPDGGRLRAAADEAYLWLLFESGTGRMPDELLLGFDVIDPAAGDFRWPGRVDERLPVGLEFVLRAAGDEVRVMVDPPSNPFALDRVEAIRGTPRPPPEIADPLPGFFQGRWQQRFNRPYRTRANEDGVYDSLRVVTNRRRFARDGTEFAGFGYDRGILRRGAPPDGLWERLDAVGVLEVRIPWMLLNFTDPSQRRVLQDPAAGELPGEFGTETVPGIRIVAAAREGGRWRRWPASGRADDVAQFTWATWEEPTWLARERPVYGALREVFR